jgi:hypothetical protein
VGDSAGADEDTEKGTSGAVIASSAEGDRGMQDRGVFVSGQSDGGNLYLSSLEVNQETKSSDNCAWIPGIIQRMGNRALGCAVARR